MKSFFLVSLFLVLALAQVSANCSGNCPDTEEVVWALSPGGGGCSVFRNKCYFTKANCVRRPALTITTKEKCQRLCPEICPLLYRPTTGNYRGQIREFSNDCVKNVHSCRTGETFL
ncbi:uncharacterized protein [Drosophila pseudoobscura]|uniref:Salivary glue protein Sgs-5 n=1 Tax=Drosophila pseudoobscura pseudoobscura TaxID=46245 RepID=A0A6I8V5R6_DROPS|nr:uncharacterized protein LOC13036525 [Drosophila pseudoobscura]